MPALINFKPWSPPVNRCLRYLLLVVCVLLAVNLYIFCNDYATAYQAVSNAEQNVSTPTIQMMQADLEAAKQERDAAIAALDKLSGGGDGVRLDEILSVVRAYKPQGIRILTINTAAVTGYGPDLEVVTRFIASLSDALGIEVSIKNILQLDLSGTVTGFDLQF